MKYIKGFNAIRAISILFVLQAHMGLYYLLPEHSFFRHRFWYLISGGSGVNIFFVLSGFLITRILLKEKSENSGHINLRKFYIRRLLRLTPPLVILFLALFVLMINGHIKESYLGLIMASTYTFNFAPMTNMTPELGHVWSLSVEEQYYFLWPLVLLIFKDYKKLLYLSGAIIIICIFFRQNLGHIPFIDTNSISIYGYDIILGNYFNPRRWFIPAIAPIIIGSSFAILAHYQYSTIGNIFYNRKSIILISLLLFLSPLFMPLAIKASYYTIQAFGVGMLLTWITFNQERKIYTILEHPVLRYIGHISYGLYVYHGIFVRTGPTGATLSVQQFPINIILTFIAAVISYELIEKRVLKYKERLK